MEKEEIWKNENFSFKLINVLVIKLRGLPGL